MIEFNEIVFNTVTFIWCCAISIVNAETCMFCVVASVYVDNCMFMCCYCYMLICVATSMFVFLLVCICVATIIKSKHELNIGLLF